MKDRPVADIDELIRQTLSEEDSQWFEEWDEQSLTEMVVGSFRGKSRWLVVVVTVCVILFSILMVTAAILFFRVETPREMILYATVFLFSNIAIAMLKAWYWMQLNRNIVTRELKKIELQLAMISNRHESDTDDVHDLDLPNQPSRP